MSKRHIEVKSSFGGYEVQFLPTLADCVSAIDQSKSWFLIDDRVFGLYQNDFKTVDPKRCVRWVANEENKTFANFEPLFEKLLDAGFKKNSHLVVVGGGILQDAGGFVASVIYRGVTWDLIPTTLLAQADSCIGAKTSVNLTRAKNLLGTFNAPKRVLLTTSVLKTLDSADIKSGLAEAVKLGIVEGETDVKWMLEHLAGAIDGAGLEEFLYRSLNIKKRYIEEDEFDRGVRNLLNVGHTFAHAFEAISNYAIPHGIAVGIGMRAAAYFSVQKGFAEASFLNDVTTLMAPLTIDHMAIVKRGSAHDYVQVMKSDKKNTSGDITFILGRGHGKLFKHQLPANEAEVLLASFLASV